MHLDLRPQSDIKWPASKKRKSQNFSKNCQNFAFLKKHFYICTTVNSTHMVFQGNGTNLLPPFVANLQFGQPLAICQWSLWHSLVKAEKFVYIYVSSCLFTDLGNLIGDTQCGTFRFFQPLRFYVKSILVILKPPKTAIWTS